MTAGECRRCGGFFVIEDDNDICDNCLTREIEEEDSYFRELTEQDAQELNALLSCDDGISDAHRRMS